MEPSTVNTLRSKLVVAGLALVGIYLIGTLGYFAIGHGQWSLGDCAYMTIISLTTTGYGEVLRDFHRVPYARLFTGFLLLGGAGVLVYFVSALTTFFVEGEFLQERRKKKMEKLIERLNEHIIVCGGGGTGRHVISELEETHWPFVVIEANAERIGRLQEDLGTRIPLLQGDATDDKVLLEAGIQRAHGIVAALPEDKDNLYVVVTARGLNPGLRVVTKAVDPVAVRKFTAAGAHSVVSVNAIGGLRMASEMIRPNVVSFLDKMLRDKDKKLRFEEVTIPPTSPLVQTRLANSDIRKSARNLLIVAARDQSGAYIYSPGPDFILEAGMTLILLGETESVQHLRKSRLFAWSEDSE